MASLRLYGTVTSPYVRRVRIVAAELGVGCELLDTSTPEGQAALREVTPIWKVPVAVIDEELVFDSHAITERLLAAHGPGPLRPYDPYDVQERNAVAVIDGALDSLVNVFYLRREGVDPAEVPYVAKQIDRADAALRWLDGHASDGDLFDVDFGLLEIATLTALDWIRFREVHPVGELRGLAAVVDRFHGRPSVSSTRPGM